MAFIETDPYRIEITKHVLRSIDIRITENVHRVTVDSFDGVDNLVKTDIIDLPVFDISNSVIMPISWPTEWPSGAQLYLYLEQAFYRRLQEEKPWLIGEGAME
jgi:hypothetical protein